MKNHLEVTGASRNGTAASYDGVICRKGKEKPVILNDAGLFKVIAAKDLQDCDDCPHPCV